MVAVLAPAGLVEAAGRSHAGPGASYVAVLVRLSPPGSMLEVAASYRGNWRDIVVFVCAILFTIIWWYTDHTRNNYWVMFIVMIVVSVAAGIYAARGVLRALRTYARGLRAERRGQ